MPRCEVCGKSVFFEFIRYYVPDEKGNRHFICNTCNQKFDAQVNGDFSQKMLKYDSKARKIIVVDKEDGEIRKKCNVCNHIFCYTNVDVAMNKEKAKNAKISAVAGLGGILGGDNTTGAVYNSNAQNSLNQIIDYNKCPKCGSIDLRTLSKEEYQLEIKNNSPTSPVDELKKYKKLLDEGIITQEEFERKKKQLLEL